MKTLVVVFALLLTGCIGKFNNTQMDRAYNPPPAQESLARGQALFGQHCAVCHGADGKGSLQEPDAADLTAEGVHRTRFKLTLVTDKPHFSGETISRKAVRGSEVMPSFRETLNEQQLEDVSNWVKKLIYNP